MMRQYELVDRVKRYNPNTDEELLNRAYVYAMRAHGTQKRASGDPFFAHPLEVAALLTDLKLDDATIVAAVLHDTVEDTEATLEEIENLFGPDIRRLVDGLTKIKKLDLVSKKAAQGENFRKLLLAIVDDIRVLLVKLADRLHNMRTLHYMAPEKRLRIAEETVEIYAPLAGRMGMQELREELEELAFRHIKPEAHETITKRLEEVTQREGRVISEIENDLKTKLAERGIEAQVYGRRKRPYSIWKKMERKSVSFEQLSDIFGFRVIVEKPEDCYRVLGIVHMTWPMVPGRYKDYISTPKQNDYRSLHTTVVGPGRQRVELQIRTDKMDRVAEYGIAAHARYKDGRTAGAIGEADESRAYQWLRRTVDLLAEGDNPEEFLEHTKLELFHDQVFCFTPKGRLIALPRGATPIDFAYAVHTDVGNTAVGARINGRIAPLLTELQNGDEVEITRAEGQAPPAAWESLAVTGKARAAIRRATRAAVRRQYAGLGRQILERAFQRAERAFSDEKLKAALKRLARSTVDDVFAAVGRGEMFSGDVVKAVYPDLEPEKRLALDAKSKGGAAGKGWFELRQGGENLKFKLPEESPGADAIPIRGLGGDLPVRFAPGGGAVPGDRIVGILTPGEAVTIYPIQSPSLAAFDNEPERWLDVRWDLDDKRPQRFPARIQLNSINEPGSLAQITTTIAEHDGNIDAVQMVRPTPDFTDVTIDLTVWDLKHLSAIVSELREKRVISRVERVVA
ncbi:bifunctional (p)ppGpp synthetase/guanosine-3',5'-bis(diphosphate) 3'-pyrophosphohydrolase [Bosea sp. (in: a-proteobacteria)]|uniref:RelA/SpoT family protein n=1 Tax=Bosea sp. (in: a-proteobacteria) TaxID=1871050 RepID=UPI001AC506EB|nr:bifunctional (p)ppGpp synthetase/guanosine-3',5'-bis(diphosphate) 3'-pyrophosphohydrolase [Bosea sp. (in: a-proteobacteria)]MBN9439490.1 bifunctional (p)ppGpp synthetase/guanosine-3',5'-bis(diphosphate) 3'-pyrophosphohydrolase [Bosea sp. (in: a-proteobacteria)]MBN9446663.1 bifunctional (p)ppGpp synthetase/guanosine-3',5'-bis(diphosphate) 3'-pyrophosphohydrolase [Bosea sp. (in: a-proteobacteria)]MBN9470598.1 bifunctional (p)ppGpp synthetase/guanosine-3',5'-bis(diphosphate) 3'-pyrophosphohydrol